MCLPPMLFGKVEGLPRRGRPPDAVKAVSPSGGHASNASHRSLPSCFPPPPCHRHRTLSQSLIKALRCCGFGGARIGSTSSGHAHPRRSFSLRTKTPRLSSPSFLSSVPPLSKLYMPLQQCLGDSFISGRRKNARPVFRRVSNADVGRCKRAPN
jgi:hypothetical protein